MQQEPVELRGTILTEHWEKQLLTSFLISSYYFLKNRGLIPRLLRTPVAPHVPEATGHHARSFAMSLS